MADDDAIRTLDDAIYIPDGAILHTQEKLIWDIAYRIPEAYSTFAAARRAIGVEGGHQAQRLHNNASDVAYLEEDLFAKMHCVIRAHARAFS